MLRLQSYLGPQIPASLFCLTNGENEAQEVEATSSGQQGQQGQQAKVTAQGPDGTPRAPSASRAAVRHKAGALTSMEHKFGPQTRGLYR